MKVDEIRAMKIKNDIRMVVNETLIQTGMASGEITYAKAAKIYGEWFRRAVQDGKLSPCRVGQGDLVKKWYSIADILALKSIEFEKALVVLSQS